MQISEKIEALCVKRGMTVTELLQKCELPKNTVSRWDKYEPGYYKLLSIAKVLGVSVGVFDPDRELMDETALSDKFLQALVTLTKNGTISWTSTVEGQYGYVGTSGGVAVVVRPSGTTITVTTNCGACKEWLNPSIGDTLLAAIKGSDSKVLDFMKEIIYLSEGVSSS